MKIRACLCLIFFLSGIIFALPCAGAEDDSDRQTGSVTNNCNGEIIVTFISRAGDENDASLMPSQSTIVPRDTVEVKAELMDAIYGDETMSVAITMPDGSAHTLQSLPGSVRIPQSTDNA